MLNIEIRIQEALNALNPKIPPGEISLKNALPHAMLIIPVNLHEICMKGS